MPAGLSNGARNSILDAIGNRLPGSRATDLMVTMPS